MYIHRFLCKVVCLGFLCVGVAGIAFGQNTIVDLKSSSQQVWRVRSQVEVGTDLRGLFENFKADGWVTAVVPGTVYTAYVAAGLEKDPNYADNIWKADKAKFDQPYWYVTQFTVPASLNGEILWLNFEGINRQGEIYLNGEKLGALDGFMQRGKYDITRLVRAAGANTLAVLVSPPRHPMANAASPTYVSSGGWDWMPYIPGLNAGITDDVYLSTSGALTIQDPWIRTQLPTNASAFLTVALDVKNNTTEQHTAVVKGVINPGNIVFEEKINVGANSTTQVTLDKRHFSQLVVHNPKLWWPNGYGDPNLYTCEFSVVENNKTSDTKQVKFGMKQYTYDTLGQVLHISINGTRVFVKGGNWSMSEYMLRCRGDEYDTKVRLHREMNFNMIRNWIGSTTDEEFYEACDKYGIMVWDDFWLNSNPSLPRDVSNFNANAVEKIVRLRNHPSIAVWCADNEGWPEAPLNKWLEEDVRAFDGGDRYYQANSHADNLSGSGPWANRDPRYYFTENPTCLGGNDGWGFRTELGSAVFTNVESFKKFMPKEHWWPRNDMWEKHFFGNWAFNADADGYDRSIETRYGKPSNIEEYCRRAQLVNIETNKAMYEGWLDRIWNDAAGIMTWTSNAGLPTLIWQTYDYYYDLNGAYWGIKSACEPIHIQWNPVSDAVKVVNTTRKDVEALTAEAMIYNLDGTVADKYTLSQKVDAMSNAAVYCFALPFGGERGDLAKNKPVVASSTESGRGEAITDGDESTRWASAARNNEWVYVDLGAKESISGVRVKWETAYAKVYKIQVSDDASSWKDAATVSYGKEGAQEVTFNDDAEGRYVRVYGVERGTGWGYSLYDLKVYGGTPKSSGLTPVHFIRLRLKDKAGKVVSENVYWRGNKRKDFTALNSLKPADVKVVSSAEKVNGKQRVKAQIVNGKAGVAFAVRVQVLNARTGEQVLPAFISDGYFTLMPGESRNVNVEFDASLVGSDGFKVVAEPYNGVVAGK
jgi:hypothetical protein